jgi:AcrR family transcriptional regulator
MSPRTKQAYGQLRDERIEEIYTAAYKVFSSQGYRATMMEDIAKAADISKGLIYHYFTSKDELYTAMVKRTMQGALKLIRDSADLPVSPWERLQWLMVEIITRAQQNPEEFLVIMQAYVTDAVPAEVRAMVIQYTTTISETIRGSIIEGQAAGQVIQGNPDKLAMTLTACLHGLVLNTTIPTYQQSQLIDANIVLQMLKA